jgi:tRNA-binding protein
MISLEDFYKIDMRVGCILQVEQLSKSKRGTFKIMVDFGPDIGSKWSCMKTGDDYTKSELLGRQVIGVVNIEKKNVAGFTSEALLLGVKNNKGGLSLLITGYSAEIGGRVY